jgi:hypothetical protein
MDQTAWRWRDARHSRDLYTKSEGLRQIFSAAAFGWGGRLPNAEMLRQDSPCFLKKTRRKLFFSVARSASARALKSKSFLVVFC